MFLLGETMLWLGQAVREEHQLFPVPSTVNSRLNGSEITKLIWFSAHSPDS